MAKAFTSILLILSITLIISYKISGDMTENEHLQILTKGKNKSTAFPDVVFLQNKEEENSVEEYMSLKKHLEKLQDLVIQDIYKKFTKKDEEIESLKAQISMFLDKSSKQENELKEIKTVISANIEEIDSMKQQTDKNEEDIKSLTSSKAEKSELKEIETSLDALTTKVETRENELDKKIDPILDSILALEIKSVLHSEKILNTRSNLVSVKKKLFDFMDKLSAIIRLTDNEKYEVNKEEQQDKEENRIFDGEKRKFEILDFDSRVMNQEVLNFKKLSKSIVKNMTKQIWIKNFKGFEDSESFIKTLKNNESIKTIHFRDNQISEEALMNVCRGIKFNSSITNISFDTNNMTEEVVKCLSEVLKVNKNIKEFTIMDKISDKGIEHISDALKVNESKDLLLILRNCHITDLGFKFLGEALKVNKSVQRIFLDDNNMSIIGAQYIKEALEINKNITQVYLGDSTRSMGKDLYFAINDLAKRNENDAKKNKQN